MIKSLLLSILKQVNGRLGKLSIGQRTKIENWFKNWLAMKALEKPGPWTKEYEKSTKLLAQTIYFKLDKENIVLECDNRDKPTLQAILRGTTWFDGEEDLARKLMTVVISS